MDCYWKSMQSIKSHKDLLHRLVIDYQYQLINWYRLILIDIDCHRSSISSIGDPGFMESSTHSDITWFRNPTWHQVVWRASIFNSKYGITPFTWYCLKKLFVWMAPNVKPFTPETNGPSFNHLPPRVTKTYAEVVKPPTGNMDSDTLTQLIKLYEMIRQS